MSQSSVRLYKSSKKVGKTEKFQDYEARKSERYAKRGKEFEETVATLLSKMAGDEKISGFTHNQANSHEDQQGKDFIVWVKKENDEVTTRSFGVTISFRSWNDSRLRHQNVPQFFFPLETKPETIEKKILELFNS